MTAQSDTKPFSLFEWILALRYLRARRKEGFISVIAGFSFLGITLGVATLIIVMSVMNGFHKELFAKILGLNGHMVVHKTGGNFTDYNEVAQRVRKVDGVKSVMPLIEGQAMISSPAIAKGALIRGLAEADLKGLESISGNVHFGTLDGFDEKPVIAIGTRLANALGVRVGDSVTLVSPRGASTPFGIAPRVKRYPIAAIFEIGMSEYDETIVFLPLKEAQRYFNLKGRVNVLEVIVNDPDKVGNLHKPVMEAGGAEIHVNDWRQRNRSFFQVLQVEKNVMFFILLLIIVVAAFNIIAGLIMLVKDKGRDIAVLRTMGATRGAIMRVFLITGASIGIVGTLAGFLLGVLVCANIEAIRQFIGRITGTNVFDPTFYYLSKMPAEMEASDVTLIMILSFAVSVLATIPPALRAARMDPVEALRYE